MSRNPSPLQRAKDSRLCRPLKRALIHVLLQDPRLKPGATDRTPGREAGEGFFPFLHRCETSISARSRRITMTNSIADATSALPKIRNCRAL